MSNVAPVMSESDRQLILGSQMFGGVDIEDLGHLISKCEILDISSDTTLFNANDRNEYFYVILSGALKVFLDAEIPDQFIALQPGDCVGEISVFDGARTSALVVASEDSRLLRISEENLWRMARASHNFARNLLHILARRMRNNNLTVVNSMRHQQKLEKMANLDGLTGLFNRRWMDEFFKRQMIRALKDNKPLAMLLTDIDHFKKVNDTHGHPVGDEVLCGVASVLTQHIRPSDLLARYGGEEFALILPDTTPEEALLIAERIRAAIDSTTLINMDSEAPLEIHVTLSLGVTNLVLGDDINTLLARADQALYRAKENGRNRVEVC